MDLATLRKNLEELDSIQQKFDRIVLNELEKRRKGIKEEKAHVTFASKSSDFISDVPADEVEESPIIPQNSTYQQATPSNIETITAEPISESIIESETIEDTGEVRSESILDTINQPQKSINLNQINTGIEYDEGTSFVDESPLQ
jgi:hypothetical protein